MSLFFETNTRTWPLSYLFPGFNIYPDVKKLFQGHRAILSYLDLKFPQFQPRKGNFPLYSYSKEIDLTNYKLGTSNYELKVHEFFIYVMMFQYSQS